MSVSPARPQRRGLTAALVAVAVCAAAGLGVLIGYLVFDESEPEQPGTALDMACELAEPLAVTHGREEDWDLESSGAANWKAHAAGSLLLVAGMEGQGGQALRDLGTELTREVGQFDGEGIAETLGKVSERCAQRH